ncbi:MAG: DUF4129 domain-containing protein [Cyanobacteria bacterium J06639_14]
MVPVYISATSYRTDSLTWQARQTLRRFREWVEYQQPGAIDRPDMPNWVWLQKIGQGVFWLLMAVLVIWLGWLLYRALKSPLRDWLAQDQQWIMLGKDSSTEPDTHSPQYWWQQAQVYAQQSSYGEACLALYKATLQHLNDTQQLLHDPSRTDGEYLQNLTQVRSPRPYQLLIRTHERLTFGPAIASAEIFQRCRRAYQEMQKK